MMDSDALPIDFSHPAVKQYLALIRLQVLTPLSLLINIATVLVCTVVVSPSIGGVSHQYPTSIAPNTVIIGIYLIAIYIGQLGYCVLLVLARKEDTKRALTKGVGFSLVLANWVMAAWAICWVLQWFIASTVLLGLLIIFLTFSNVVLLIYHPPISARPLDTALIHAPLRFFLALPVMLMFPYSLFINLGLSYYPSDPPREYAAHPWPGFGVVVGTNLVALGVIIFRKDIVLTVAATWVCVSLWGERPKPAEVYIPAILFTALHPLALVVSALYTRMRTRKGHIALPPDHPDAPHRHEDNGVRRGPDGQERPARELDAEALWGDS